MCEVYKPDYSMMKTAVTRNKNKTNKKKSNGTNLKVNVKCVTATKYSFMPRSLSAGDVIAFLL